MKKFARKVRKAVKVEMPKYYRHLNIEMDRRRQAEQIAEDLKEQAHDMAKTINALQAEKVKALEKIDEVVADAAVIAKQRDDAESKVLSYMESASMYKGENEDLRARVTEVEEMLRQTESKLEISNKLLQESERELQQQTEMKTIYFNTANTAVKIKDEQEATINHQAKLIKELQEEVAKPWYKKLLFR